MKNSKFFFYQVRGISFDGSIIKFNLVNLPTSESSSDGESVTVITNYERFRGMLDFLNEEHQKIKKFMGSDNLENKNDVKLDNDTSKNTKKILSSYEDH